MADAVLTRRTKVDKSYQLLADITVETAKTSVDFTGLNIGKAEEIVLNISYLSPSGATLRFFVNDNTTVSNYYVQHIYAVGTTIAPARTNVSEMVYASTSGSSYANVKIKLTNNGYCTFQSDTTRHLNGNIGIQNFYGTSTFTMSSITKITIISDYASQIGIGSRFQLYRSSQ